MAKILGIRVIPMTVCVVLGLGLISCGTLGGIGDSIYFPLPKTKVLKLFDTLFVQHPEYKIPQAWKKYNDWSERGYDFLESRIVYFKSQPREMYYITFLDDGLSAKKNKTGIGIRAICNGDPKWVLDKDMDEDERERIEKRFDNEIVSKLEKYGNCKSWKE